MGGLYCILCYDRRRRFGGPAALKGGRSDRNDWRGVTSSDNVHPRHFAFLIEAPMGCRSSCNVIGISVAGELKRNRRERVGSAVRVRATKRVKKGDRHVGTETPWFSLLLCSATDSRAARRAAQPPRTPADAQSSLRHVPDASARRLPRVGQRAPSGHHDAYNLPTAARKDVCVRT